MNRICARLLRQVSNARFQLNTSIRNNTAASGTSTSTVEGDAGSQETDQQEVHELDEVEEVLSMSPDVFHTRYLNVHEAFRRFRPPRHAWIHSFSDMSKRGLVELHPVVFAANPRIDLIYEVIKWQDQCTREDEIQYMRSELPGSGRKLRPQKGTGRARIKDKRAPHFQYGGRPLGRRPRDHGYDIDLHVLAQGFSAICTSKLSQGDFYLVDSLQNFTIPSLVGFKQEINSESVLFVTGYEGLSSSQNTEICFHPGIDLLTSETVHPKAMLQHMKLVMDYAAFTQLERWVLDIGQEHRLIEQLEFHQTS